MKNYISEFLNCFLEILKFTSLIALIVTFIFLIGVFCNEVKAQPQQKPVFQEIVYQNQDMDMVVIYDFFGVNTLSCHSKIQSIMKVEISVQGQTLPPALVYPSGTVALCNHSQVYKKTVTFKYWKYQWPMGTGNTEWLYCGEFQFYVN